MTEPYEVPVLRVGDRCSGAANGAFPQLVRRQQEELIL